MNHNPLENLSAAIKYILQGFEDFKHLLVASCDITNCNVAILLKKKHAVVISEALTHRIICIFGLPKL